MAQLLEDRAEDKVEDRVESQQRRDDKKPPRNEARDEEKSSEPERERAQTASAPTPANPTDEPANPSARADDERAIVESHPAKKARPFYRRPVPLIIIAVILLAATYYGVGYYHYTASHETTDDAFIDTHLLQVSPKVAGHLVKIYVDDNQPVKKGDLLAEIDPRDFQTQLASAQAQLASAQAKARFAEADLARYQELYKKGIVSRQQFDTSVASARTNDAEIRTANAAIEQAKLSLSYTKIFSPQEGRVANRNVEVGTFVQAGQVLMAVVPGDYWITANFKETQLAYIRPGQAVEIRIDAYPGKIFPGHVDSIQSGTGSAFSLLPPENATGSYVKVVQRVPVKIVFNDPPDKNFPLGVGMSVEPAVQIK